MGPTSICEIRFLLRQQLHIPTKSNVHKIKVISPSKKKVLIYFKESTFKVMKNDFYYILKSFFRSQDIYILVLTFGHAENSLIRKIRLISKFMTSQPRLQTITINLSEYLTNNYNKPFRISHKGRLLDNELWSANRIEKTLYYEASFNIF